MAQEAQTATRLVPQPMIVLPAQTGGGSAGRLVPELGLVTAILHDAVESILRGYDVRGRDQDFAPACKWVFDDNRCWPFAFRNVCDFLGLDAAALRESLLARTRRLQPRERRPEEL